ncbi:MAG TPA: hypothetical protein VFF04_06635 [Candidatus Babeliales bacterium]|nr:hypothetical protein [Candidatus Babeliales bacterium]
MNSKSILLIVLLVIGFSNEASASESSSDVQTRQGPYASCIAIAREASHVQQAQPAPAQGSQIQIEQRLERIEHQFEQLINPVDNRSALIRYTSWLAPFVIPSLFNMALEGIIPACRMVHFNIKYQLDPAFRKKTDEATARRRYEKAEAERQKYAAILNKNIAAINERYYALDQSNKILVSMDQKSESFQRLKAIYDIAKSDTDYEQEVVKKQAEEQTKRTAKIASMLGAPKPHPLAQPQPASA